MKLYIPILLEIENISEEEYEDALLWYQSTCRHKEPDEPLAYAKIAATRFVNNIVDMHRTFKLGRNI